MTSHHFTSAFRKPDSTDATLKMFSAVKTVATIVAIFVVAYDVALLLAGGGDSSPSALSAVHIAILLLIFMLADAGGRVMLHLQASR